MWVDGIGSVSSFASQGMGSTFVERRISRP